jgi:nucleoside-diphosphate-sugar epimerase
MKRVLVVGGAGFLGSFALHRLLQDGCPVWATHSPGNKPAPILGVNWIECDLASLHATSHWPTKCDFVIYLAQSRQYRSFPEAAENIFAVNVNGLHQAMHYAYRVGARGVVVASTGSVYTAGQKPVTESISIDIQAQRTYYVATKLAAEVLASSYNAILPVVQLRIFTPYGGGQNSSMLFPQLVQRIREGRAVSLHGQGGLIANPVYAADVAEAIHRCLSLQQGGTFNLAGPESLNLRQIATTIGKILEREPTFEVESADKPPMLVGAMDALQSALAWTPTTSLEAGLRTWLKPAHKACA